MCRLQLAGCVPDADVSDSPLFDLLFNSFCFTERKKKIQGVKVKTNLMQLNLIHVQIQ